MAVQIDRAICLHIPKTGGTFVRNYFKETGMSHGVKALEERAHMNAYLLRETIGHTEDLIFCFVRHPLTWYRSYWTSKQQIPDRRGGPLDEIVDESWETFIETVINKYPRYLEGFYEGYTEICRFIGKQENLRDNLDTVLRFLRIPYNREYLFKRVPDNVVPSKVKYTMLQAMAIMDHEKNIIKKYNYNYIPTEAIN